MVRSPRAFMKIAESAVERPGMRRQYPQSIFSRASAAKTRSPLESSPAGPPIGPASDTRAPSRAIATAAFAAQPPLTTKNPVAWTFPSGSGKSVTRNTSSRTMIPAQRIRTAGLTEDIASVLDIIADDMMRDRNGRRRGQSAGMTQRQHLGKLFALEPARILDFAPINHDLVCFRFGMAADHQRHRKRPRLRGEVVHAAGGDANFLEHFAPHRFLDGLPRFTKSGQARPHSGGEAGRPAKNATLAGNHQHNHHRIGPGEMFDMTGRTIAPPAAMDRSRRRTAIRAKAMLGVPTDHRLGFGERGQVLAVDQPLNG